MYRTHPIVAFVLVAVGAIWIGQGMGLIRGGSFMVGDVRWAVAGAVIAVVGIVLLIRAMLHRRS
ncbi:MAG: hypothetical protein M3R57_10425 [Chloroflexota bacterium]|nr:hypothetical protein [Chloroflexota bacterium]